MKDNNTITPVITYSNAHINKSLIFKENKGKSGIYRLNNLVNGKCYVGSSKGLSNRLRAYYSTSNIKRIVSKESSIIYSAILKYGHKNFSLDILEYCEISVLIKKEQYYIDYLKPEYNILNIANSRLGHKLSEKTKKAVSIALRGKKYKVNLLKVITKSNAITYETRLKISSRCKGISVKVYDKSNNLVKAFPTITSAAKYFGFSSSTIRRIEKGGVSYDDYIYKFEVKDTRIWVYDCNKNLINIYNSISKVSESFNIPPTTLSRYIKSGKLYENTFYFQNTELNLVNTECTIKTISPSLSNTLSKETKQLISNVLKNRLKLLPIQVTNIETNAIKCFANNRDAAKSLNISEKTLIRYKSKGKILLKKYRITNDITTHKNYK